MSDEATAQAVKVLEEKIAQLQAQLAQPQPSTSSAHSNTSNSDASEKNLRIKPDSFSGKPDENWAFWLRKFKSIASLNRWEPALQREILPAYLKGLAEQTFYSLTPEQTDSWTALERALTERFHPKEARQVHLATLRAKVRGKEDDLHELRYEIARLVDLAYPEDPPEIIDRTARDFFVGALTPPSLKEKVLDLSPPTLDEALAAALRFETNQKILQRGSPRVLSAGVESEEEGATAVNYARSSSTASGPAQPTSGQGQPPDWAMELFQRQREILQRLDALPQAGDPARAGQFRRTNLNQNGRACFSCGSLQHLKRDCPSRTPSARVGSVWDQGNGEWAGRK